MDKCHLSNNLLLRQMKTIQHLVGWEIASGMVIGKRLKGSLMFLKNQIIHLLLIYKLRIELSYKLLGFWQNIWKAKLERMLKLFVRLEVRLVADDQKLKAEQQKEQAHLLFQLIEIDHPQLENKQGLNNKSKN